MFCIGNRQTRGRSRSPTSSMVELLVTAQYQEVITLLTADLPLFSFHDRKGQKRRGLKHFTHWCLLSFLGVINKIYCLRNYCSLIDPFVYWCFYKVLFESISLFWKYSNNLYKCTKPGNFSFRNKIFLATSYD